MSSAVKTPVACNGSIDSDHVIKRKGRASMVCCLRVSEITPRLYGSRGIRE
jgi:hypothetical protein